jgi:hypothetical protein
VRCNGQGQAEQNRLYFNHFNLGVLSFSSFSSFFCKVIDVKNSIDVTVDDGSVGSYYCRVSVTGGH